MLFSYKEYIEELKDSKKERDREVYSNWVALNGSLDIKQEKYYKYFKMIKPIKYRVPVELKKDFDWNLLLRMIVISISSDYEFVFADPETTDSEEDVDFSVPELVIYVKNGDQCVSKKISELYSFQILRLYEIYCSENINFMHIDHESGLDDSSIGSSYLDNVTQYNHKSLIARNYAKRVKCFE